MSIVIEWGSGTAVPLHLLCEYVEALPSSTLAAPPFSAVGSAALAVTVQPVRGSGLGESAAGARAACAVVRESSPVGGVMWFFGRSLAWPACGSCVYWIPVAMAQP